MKKITKWMIAAGILIGAGVASTSAFAAADNGQYNQNTPSQSQQMWHNEEHRNRMEERVNQGDLTQEETDDRRGWMDNHRGSCHDNTVRSGRMNSGQRHQRMMGW